MILRTVDAGTCEENSWISDIVGFQDWDDPIEVAMTQIKARNWKPGRIGVDKNSYSLTVQRYSAWQIALPKTDLLTIQRCTAWSMILLAG